jgi:hypothetical protein
MDPHFIKRGDLLPSVVGTCEDANGPVSLEDAEEPTFKMRLPDSDEVVVSGEAEILQIGDGVEDGSKGRIRYVWSEGDTDVAGRYEAEFTVLIQSKPQTFPNRGFTPIHIGDDVSEVGS